MAEPIADEKPIPPFRRKREDHWLIRGSLTLGTLAIIAS